MKKYLLILLVALASCTTTHKTKTQINRNVDSTAVVVKDSTQIQKATTSTDNFKANGVDITFDYTNGDSTSYGQVPVTVPKGDTSADDEQDITAILKNALTGTPAVGRIPDHVTIHIDSLSNVATTASVQDSVQVKDSSNTHLKLKEDIKTKDVTRTGMSAWVYIIIGVAIIALLVWVAIWVVKKFKLI
jgi:hypothetical protein